jgi:hypothetical protein
VNEDDLARLSDAEVFLSECKSLERIALTSVISSTLGLLVTLWSILT